MFKEFNFRYIYIKLNLGYIKASSLRKDYIITSFSILSFEKILSVK